MTAGLLHLAPALLLFAALLARRYPGERGVARLATLVDRLRRPPRRTTGGALSCPPRAILDALRPRGGRLLATSLAERGPPLHTAGSRLLAGA